MKYRETLLIHHVYLHFIVFPHKQYLQSIHVLMKTMILLGSQFQGMNQLQSEKIQSQLKSPVR